MKNKLSVSVLLLIALLFLPKTANAQASNKSNYVESVRLFLYVLDDFIKGRRPPEPLRKYSRPYANPPYELKDAIHVVNDDDFVEKKLLKDLAEKSKNPKYIEERYRAIDYVYKSEIDFREKYPANTDPTQGGYGRTKEVYDFYKIVQKYIVKNDPDFDAQVAYVKKKMDKINKKFEARLNAIAINDVHKANLYKIIFTSNSRINPKTAPASAYKTTFKPGEEIFAVAMVDKPLNRNIVKKAYAQVEMKSGVDIIETVVEHQMFPVKPNQKYFVFPIVVKSSKFKCSNTEATANTEYGMRWLSNKEDRRFKIQIWLKEAKQFHNSLGLLKGTFTYDASSGDGAVVKKMANQVAAKCGRK